MRKKHRINLFTLEEMRKKNRINLFTSAGLDCTSRPDRLFDFFLR